MLKRKRLYAFLQQIFDINFAGFDSRDFVAPIKRLSQAIWSEGHSGTYRFSHGVFQVVEIHQDGRNEPAESLQLFVPQGVQML